VPLHYDRASGQISLFVRDALLRLDERQWAALDLLRRAFPDGAPHAPDVHALLDRVQAAADGARTSPFPIDVSLAPADPAPASRALLEKIERALRRRQEVTFLYRPRGRSEERLFEAAEPIELAFRHGHYYLTVYEPARNQFRELRVDRIVPESWRLLPRVVGRDLRPAGVLVQYRLAPELASGGVSERLDAQRVDWEPDGSAVVTGEARDLFWATRLVLGYGSQAEALQPPELRAMVAGEVSATARAYTGPGEET